MNHILIVCAENPNFLFSLACFGSDWLLIKDKTWIGIDESGQETIFNNTQSYKYLLIKDCSAEEIQKAITFVTLTYNVITTHEFMTQNLNLPLAKSNSTFLDPLSFYLQRYTYLASAAQSLLPFIIIRFLAANYLQEFIATGIQTIKSQDQGPKLTTSCINSAFSLAVLFFGESHAKTFFELVNQSSVVRMPVRLPSNKIFEYRIIGLFEGDLIQSNLKTMTDDGSTLNTGVDLFNTTTYTRFKQYIDPLIASCKQFDSDEQCIYALQQCLEHIEYPFNAYILDSLKQELNHSQVNHSSSKVYFIVINTPKKHANDAIAIEHALIIEQFYLNSAVKFRIYQSWIGEKTLNNDLIKRHYGELGEQALSLEEINKFIDHLTILYCTGKEQSAITSQSCFGYANPSDQEPLVYFKDGILSGMNVRYFAKDINPNACLPNFYRFFNQNNAFFKIPACKSSVENSLVVEVKPF